MFEFRGGTCLIVLDVSRSSTLDGHDRLEREGWQTI